MDYLHSRDMSCIWLVDDEPKVVSTLVQILSAMGWETRCFYSGEDFLSAFNEGATGVLLLDVHLKDLHAPKVLSALRIRGLSPPTVLMSGGIISGNLSCDPMVVSTITKPFKISTLQETLSPYYHR